MEGLQTMTDEQKIKQVEDALDGKKLYYFTALASTRAVIKASTLEKAVEAWWKFLGDESADWQDNDDCGEEVESAEDYVAEDNVIEVD